MLLEFRLRNYGIFRDEVALSLVASNYKTLHSENLIPTGLPEVSHVVSTCAIFGANASGKSTLIRAMSLLQGLVLVSFKHLPEAQLNVKPFLLDKEFSLQPTLFEVSVSIDGVRHQYGLEFNKERIVSEWLLVYKTARPQKWFHRYLSPGTGKEEYEFSPHFKGQKRTWQEQTRPNALFLSTAIQFNSEMLKPLYQWFSRGIFTVLGGLPLDGGYTTGEIQKGQGTDVVRFLQSADLSIHEITVEEQSGLHRTMDVDLRKGEILKSEIKNAKAIIPKFLHKVGEQEAILEFQEESDGTQKMYGLAGPLIDILDKGSVLIYDELDSRLHPLLTRKIIEIFQNPISNPNGAQLVFSSHDTSLLDADLLRRDQIWFLQKDSSQAASLTPLTDFHPRKGEALMRGYLTGRYDGIPILNSIAVPGTTDGN